MKSYTDLEQSKKLSEILPLESADMFYNEEPDETYCKDIVDTKYPMVLREGQKHHLEEYGIPCWSLAALLGVLPMIRKGEDTANPFIAKTPDDEYYIVYATLTEEVYDSSMYDNPIDACVAMIEKLHEPK